MEALQTSEGKRVGALLYLGICKCPDQPLDTETAGMWIREVIERDKRFQMVPRMSRYDERRGGCVDRKFDASK
jgi:hypothetical protein